MSAFGPLSTKRRSQQGVATWNPRREMERMFEDFFRGFRDLPSVLGEVFPSVDMYEEKDRYIVKAEVPGVDKESIHISVTDHTLHLRGEATKEETAEDGDYLYSERFYGAFSRDIPLPAAVNQDQIRATFKNGVLTIEIPKAKEAMGKEIKIEEGKSREEGKSKEENRPKEESKAR